MPQTANFQGFVLVVDADTAVGRAAVAELTRLGGRCVLGAADQERVGRLADGLPRVTVAVGDAVDAEVVLTTVADGVGALVAVVVPVPPGSGRPEAVVQPVARAMAMAAGLAEAAGSRGLPVVVVGPGAAAVVAWAREQAPQAGPLHAVPEVARLVEVGVAPVPQVGPSAPPRRRDRALQLARTLWGRLVPDPPP